jgi:hypothetical protein
MQRRWLLLLIIIGLALIGLGVYSVRSKPEPPHIPRVVFSKQLEVPANKLWFDTGIDVTGRHVTIKYDKGEWTNGGDNPQWSDGNGAGVSRVPDLIVPSGKVRELVGQTADGHFSVGNFLDFTGKRGKLYLSINDTEWTFKDNQGALMVTISFLE